MKVIELLRVSTQEQGDDGRAGLPRQRAANTLTVQKHGLTLIKTVQIIDVSGTSVMRTPEIRDLISLMHSGQIQGVVVADWDRLIRLDNFNDFALLQHFKETGTKIFLPDQVIDLNTQSGFLIGGFQSIVSGNELTQLKKRMVQAKEIKRRNGEHPNNLLSLPMGVGYDYQDRKYHYTEEIQKVRELFSLFVNDCTQNYMELERLTGIHHRTIPNLLRNELYIGYRTYRQKRSPEKNVRQDGRQGDRKKVSRSPEEVIRVKVIDQPAIPETVFREAVEVAGRKNQEYHKKKSNPGQRFLYSGFLRCGVCGEMMYSTSGGRDHRRDYYYCKNKNYHYVRKNGSHICKSGYLHKKAVENTVDSFIAEKLTEPTYLAQLVKKALSHGENGKARALMGELSKRRQKILSKRSKILDLYGEGLFSKQDLDTKITQLNEELSATELRLTKIQDSLIARDRITTDSSILPLVSAVTEFSFWQPSQKRSFLRSQIPEITLTKDGVTGIRLNFCKSGIRTGMDSLLQPA